MSECQVVIADSGNRPLIRVAHHFKKKDGVWTCIHCGEQQNEKGDSSSKVDGVVGG